ncbi:DUF6680 family protein [Caulobacter sp. FWC2]|uniref:DUF6680 family protein n=1 Tax=Caulobacter sp. FWC2 TaxID=69664 RepID=UPI001178A0F9|nr:DUF6680 family protein [Caulobacter sp. FWC2]
MATQDPNHALFLGFALKDIIGAILIPIVAVLTTLFYQDKQGQKKERMQVLRMLLATRHMPSDPAYSTAINLIRVEFNSVKSVMDAHTKYIEQINLRVPPEGEALHQNQVAKAQTKLISSIMKCLGLKFSEADIQSDAYAAAGFINRDNLYLDSMHAARDSANSMRDVAVALRFQTELLANQIAPAAAPILPPAAD